MSLTFRSQKLLPPRRLVALPLLPHLQLHQHLLLQSPLPQTLLLPLQISHLLLRPSKPPEQPSLPLLKVVALVIHQHSL